MKKTRDQLAREAAIDYCNSAHIEYSTIEDLQAYVEDLENGGSSYSDLSYELHGWLDYERADIDLDNEDDADDQVEYLGCVIGYVEGYVLELIEHKQSS